MREIIECQECRTKYYLSELKKCLNPLHCKNCGYIFEGISVLESEED